MKHFSSDDVDIAYLDMGTGDPVLLIHGFASTAHVNWVNPGWVNSLNRAGYRVIALDNRGHGQSQKLHDPSAYEAPTMAEDARRLLDHLELEQADVMGYSMGARITAFLSISYPQRVRSAILGGVGANLIEGTKGTQDIVAALEAPSLEAVTTPVGRAFRKFADANKADLKALAACMRSGRPPITRERLAALPMPVLVAVGTRDDVAGSAAALTGTIPHAQQLDIPDRDHMLAVGDKVFKQGVIDFLNERP